MKRMIRSILSVALLLLPQSLAWMSLQPQGTTVKTSSSLVEGLNQTSPALFYPTHVRNQLSPFEQKCAEKMDTWYEKSLELKCPFFRRRAADTLDTIDNIMRFVLIRHKSLDLIGPKPAMKCKGAVCDKRMNYELEEIMEIIRKDWRTENDKGYYITGKLTTSIYRDDCFFDGPDPDMPVKGLRKYLNAASQLFEQKTSRSKLLSLRIEDGIIVADWKMNGVLRLPWKPTLPTWTGTTYYFVDDTGLIYKHLETWDMGVVEAFVKTLWPALARLIWPKDHPPVSSPRVPH